MDILVSLCLLVGLGNLLVVSRLPLLVGKDLSSVFVESTPSVTGPFFLSNKMDILAFCALFLEKDVPKLELLASPHLPMSACFSRPVPK